MAAPTIETRKPAGDLTPLDFATFPIWEYVMDEDQFDETYVRPVAKSSVPKDGELFHIGVELQSAGGSIRPGCIEIFDGSYRFPGTFLGEELCDLEPRGSQTYLEVNGILDPEIERVWMKQMETIFAEPFAAIFPIRWTLRVPHSDHRRANAGVLLYTPHKGCVWREDDV